jgi:hypothetical protein
MAETEARSSKAKLFSGRVGFLPAWLLCGTQRPLLVYSITSGDLKIGEPGEATADFGKGRNYCATGMEVAGVAAD